jgi:hypothetical protein
MNNRSQGDLRVVRLPSNSSRIAAPVGCLGLFLLLLAPFLRAAGGAGLWVGVWTRDAVRSTCDPGPCPKVETSTVTKWDDGITIVLETEGADGTKSTQQVSLRFDGKPYPAFDLSGKATGAQWAIHQTGERTFERVIRRGEKIAARQTYMFSEDGNTRVTTLVGVTPDGRPQKNVTYWTRR